MDIKYSISIETLLSKLKKSTKQELIKKAKFSIQQNSESEFQNFLVSYIESIKPKIQILAKMISILYDITVLKVFKNRDLNMLNMIDSNIEVDNQELTKQNIIMIILLINNEIMDKIVKLNSFPFYETDLDSLKETFLNFKLDKLNILNFDFFNNKQNESILYFFKLIDIELLYKLIDNLAKIFMVLEMFLSELDNKYSIYIQQYNSLYEVSLIILTIY